MCEKEKKEKQHSKGKPQLTTTHFDFDKNEHVQSKQTADFSLAHR